MTSVLCAVCGNPDPFDQGLCPACGGALRQSSDSLLFLRPTGSWLEEKDHEERLAAIIGDRADTARGREAATGARALLRVPGAAAARVAALLESRGLSTRAIPVERAFTGLPLQFFAMLTGILVVGSYAGYTALPILAATSPALALALLAYGHFDAQQSLLGGSRAKSGLPRNVERALVSAFAELPNGSAREQLVDITRVARTVLAALPVQQRELRASVGELVMAACATTLDVSRLDVTLASISEEKTNQSGDDASLKQLRERCATMRAQRVDQLAHALHVLGTITSDAVDSQDAAGSQLGSVTRELMGEASAHEYAQREISALLR